MNGQPRGPVDLPSEKDAPVAHFVGGYVGPSLQEFHPGFGGPEPVWNIWRKEHCRTAVGNGTAIRLWLI